MFVATCVNLEIIILNEVNQTERQMPYDIIYMWNLKLTYGYKTETDSWTQRTDLCLPREVGWGEMSIVNFKKKSKTTERETMWPQYSLGSGENWLRQNFF